MQRRSDSCSRWARAGLDRREGRNLMLRGVRALGRRLLRRTGADGGGFRRHLGRGTLGEVRDCSRSVLKHRIIYRRGLTTYLR